MGVMVLIKMCRGHLTCKDASVVDYFIASSSLTQSIIDFQVLDYDNILSDVHCPLVLHVDGFSENNVGHRRSTENNVSAKVRKKSFGSMNVILRLLKALIWRR